MKTSFWGLKRFEAAKRMYCIFIHFILSLRYSLSIAKSIPDCVKWGDTFGLPLISKNVEQSSCSLPSGKKICCSSLQRHNFSDIYSKPIGSNYSPKHNHQHHLQHQPNSKNCEVTKEYFSSPQELRDYHKTIEISKLSDDYLDKKRLSALSDYIFSEEYESNSTTWLHRVAVHMHQRNIDHSKEPHRHDLEFLSRYEFSKICNGKVVERWIEWIEPLTITARHPFSLATCSITAPYRKPHSPSAEITNVDYILLQSGRNLYKQSLPDHEESIPNDKSAKAVPKHFLLDAGTSTFDSSLIWFTCAYSQIKVGFDQVFGWEMTLLEPNDFWNRVPGRWKPYWHFYNIPVSADPSSPQNPQNFLEDLATPSDFVAFKLDIDTPEVEIPIAEALLTNANLTALVDEFFFELHFRCEVMYSCGWSMPNTPYDRLKTLEFFLQLRKKGIRAHIWP